MRIKRPSDVAFAVARMIDCALNGEADHAVDQARQIADYCSPDERGGIGGGWPSYLDKLAPRARRIGKNTQAQEEAKCS